MHDLVGQLVHAVDLGELVSDVPEDGSMIGCLQLIVSARPVQAGRGLQRLAALRRLVNRALDVGACGGDGFRRRDLFADLVGCQGQGFGASAASALTASAKSSGLGSVDRSVRGRSVTWLRM